MFRSLLLPLLAVLAAILPGQSPSCGPHGTAATVLITPAGLAQRLHQPELVVLAVGDGGSRTYQGGHIPGAVALDARKLWTSTGGLSVELPSAQVLAEAMTRLGITPQSRIVLYPSGAGDTRVSRVYWTLDAIGLGARTSILDGGLAAWTDAGLPLERKEGRPAQRAPFPPCLQADVLADYGDVQAHLHQPGTVIVDAREDSDYSGGMEMMGRRGHIPGAVSIPEPSLISQGRYLPLEALRAKFAAAGIKPGATVVSYCHIGLMATEVYVAARLLGYQARMYDGSFEDWAAHKNSPVELSPGR
ncbi:MAG: sulfurtransferase [Terriglobales bacterium]